MANELALRMGLAAETTGRILAVIRRDGEATKATLGAEGIGKAQIEKGLAVLREEGAIVGVPRGDRSSVIWTAYILREG